VSACPQVCPECGVSLRDYTVPRRLRMSRRIRTQFTRALVDQSERPDGQTADGTMALWICPDCEHRWSTATWQKV
jgi:rubrerythrin